MEVVNALANQIPRPLGFFDLVTCLNLADRVEKPAVLVADLAKAVRPNGLLILASPLDFDLKFTPDESHWISDLRSLISPDEWLVLDTSACRYEVRIYSRKTINYGSQVLLARRKGATLLAS